MVHVEVFTDPGCPFAWSAEPQRRRIQWLYGDQIGWTTRMVVLSTTPDEYTAKGFTPDRQAAGMAALRDRYGMPIDARERPRMTATVHACRAVVAARRHAPEQAEALLLRLRMRHFVHAELIDEPAVIAGAAVEAGIDPEALFHWCAEDGTESELWRDARDARAPLPAAAALDHKLAGPPEERRYTCPSWVVHRDGHQILTAPGFQPVEVYEVLIATAAPELVRRAEPESAGDVLRAFDVPLATAEVAAVLGTSHAEAAAELAHTAEEDRGLWSFSPRFSRAAEPARTA